SDTMPVHGAHSRLSSRANHDCFKLYVRRRALLRTHTCGQLRPEHIGQEVTLCGWVDTNRDQGGIVFIDLRDRYGKTQVVFDPEGGPEVLGQASKLRTEDVSRVRGRGGQRPGGTEDA